MVSLLLMALITCVSVWDCSIDGFVGAFSKEKSLPEGFEPGMSRGKPPPQLADAFALTILCLPFMLAFFIWVWYSSAPAKPSATYAWFDDEDDWLSILYEREESDGATVSIR
jgi:hypothetical protein